MAHRRASDPQRSRDHGRRSSRLVGTRVLPCRPCSTISAGRGDPPDQFLVTSRASRAEFRPLRSWNSPKRDAPGARLGRVARGTDATCAFSSTNAVPPPFYCASRELRESGCRHVVSEGWAGRRNG